MKIGVIADSHDHMSNIRRAVQLFKDKKVNFVIHVGDYINAGTIKIFQGLKLIGVFGNNDGDKFRLVNAFSQIGGEIKGDFCEIEQDGIKFAVYHGTEPQLRDALIECKKYDVVIYGHTHVLENTKIGKTLVINPGTAHGFGDKATVLIFDTQTKQPEFIEL
ncbi:MAG: metallophosphoesterase [Thaumarchaeota archaeon]|nr:YfcE family phosphodiesterase [Nitrososphaerota archaeon]NMJ86463.1 metallophosphoesterase [Nitrososphaerota archaeon]|tara:strand:- start:2021 stop:2506 length:486 start_codon:yes stop_codon:yes gene_type:complete